MHNDLISFVFGQIILILRLTSHLFFIQLKKRVLKLKNVYLYKNSMSILTVKNQFRIKKYYIKCLFLSKLNTFRNQFVFY